LTPFKSYRIRYISAPVLGAHISAPVLGATSPPQPTSCYSKNVEKPAEKPIAGYIESIDNPETHLDLEGGV